MITKNILKILNNIIKKNIFNHAYLIEGNSSVNEIAIKLASIIFCDSNNINCNCKICDQVKNRSFSELLYINPGSTGILQEKIIEIQEFALLHPVYNKKKVIIINNADRMNGTAAAKLLKILEEPPEYLIFILTVKNTKTLLDTICSRCEIISVPTLHPTKIASEIKENYAIDKFYADHCSYICCNDIEKAFLFAENIDIIDNALNLAEQLKNSDLEKNLIFIEEIILEQVDSIKELVINLNINEYSTGSLNYFVEKEFNKYLPIRREIYFYIFNVILNNSFSDKFRIIERIYYIWNKCETLIINLFKKMLSKFDIVNNEKEFVQYGKIIIQKEMVYFIDDLSYFSRDILISNYNFDLISQLDKTIFYSECCNKRKTAWKIFNELIKIKKDIFTNVDTLGSLECLIL